MTAGSWTKCAMCENASNVLIKKADAKRYLCVTCYENETGKILYDKRQPMQKRPRREVKRLCVTCGKPIPTGTLQRSYCSKDCRRSNQVKVPVVL